MNKIISAYLLMLMCWGVMPALADDSFLGKPNSAEREALVHGHKDGLLS